MEYRVRAKAGVETCLGPWSTGDLEQMLTTASELPGLPARIDFISSRFLGVPYGESTLIGSPGTPETLVINLQAVDCFTYLDYVESMRLSRTFYEFRRNLRRVRYKSGTIEYGARNHFFTDWAASNRVEDVTGAIGREKAEAVTKTINRKKDGSSILPGIPPVERRIAFIPAGTLDGRALDGLRTGDYIGIYTPADGLDVSHTGIFIRRENRIMLRHASLKAQKVIDQDFNSYIEGKPGIVVLRPRL